MKTTEKEKVRVEQIDDSDFFLVNEAGQTVEDGFEDYDAAEQYALDCGLEVVENFHIGQQQHTPEIGKFDTCQNSHTSAGDTEKPLPTSAPLEQESTRAKNDINALNVAPQTLKKTGTESSSQLLQPTGGNANVVEKIIHNFLQSITLKETVTSIEDQGIEDGDFINFLQNKDIRKKIIDSFALIVTALGGNTENVLMKIAQAPDLLRKLEHVTKCWEQSIKTAQGFEKERDELKEQLERGANQYAQVVATNAELLEALKGITKIARATIGDYCNQVCGNPASEEWEGKCDAVHGEVIYVEELIAKAEGRDGK